MNEKEAVAYIVEWDVIEAAKVLKWYEEDKLLRHCDCDTMVAIETEDLRAENAKLRELVLDYFNAPCLECNPWAEGWEGCKHCESGNCTLAVRTLELGIEVDG